MSELETRARSAGGDGVACIASVGVIAQLCSLVALAPLTMETYIPSLPTLKSELHTSSQHVALTLTVYTASYGVLQLLLGPLSDVVGRLPVLRCALAAYTLSCAVSAAAGTIELLLAMRVVQAVGTAAANVLGQAMVRDRYALQARERVMSKLAVARSTAPLLSPVIGSALLASFGWESVFVYLAGVGAACLAGAVLTRETLQPQKRQASLRLCALFSQYATVLRSRVFLSFALAEALSFGGLFVYITNSPYLLQEFYGLPVLVAGALYCLVFIGSVCGALVAPRFGACVGSAKGSAKQRLRSFCLASSAHVAAGVACLSLSPTGLFDSPSPPSQAVFQTCMLLYAFGYSSAQVHASVQYLEPFPTLAGTAAGTAGAIRMLTVSAVTLFCGALQDAFPTATPTCIGVGCMSLGAICAFLVIRPPSHDGLLGSSTRLNASTAGTSRAELCHCTSGTSLSGSAVSIVPDAVLGAAPAAIGDSFTKRMLRRVGSDNSSPWWGLKGLNSSFSKKMRGFSSPGSSLSKLPVEATSAATASSAVATAPSVAPASVVELTLAAVPSTLTVPAPVTSLLREHASSKAIERPLPGAIASEGVAERVQDGPLRWGRLGVC